MTERDIFLAAIDIADPVQRAAWVEQACGADAGLREQVEALLKTHSEASQFLETPAAASDSHAAQTIVTNSPADNDPDAEHTSGEAEFRRYLQPATRPGWLGRLAHYEIEAILGRGAFGIVAKAFDEKLHRVVAIKLMNPELASTSPPRKRFLREARTAAAVTHENIVAIYAVEEEPIPYLVMEYIPGQTLQQRMDAKGPLDVPAILRLGQQVAAGLAAAHARNLIHRDIKPANILLVDGPTDRAKISDFGLARAVDDATMTSSGLIAGTPMYMAPEQARGESLDHRADLFSLGSVLYQVTSGRPPFRAANTVAVLKRVCEDTPRSLDDVIPGIPAWLEAIIFKLLEKNREDRYQTAQEVADLLTRCQRELEHHGKVTCVEGRPRAAETQVFHPAKSTGSDTKKPTGWLVGGVIAVVAVIAIWLMPPAKVTPDPDLTSTSGNKSSASTSGTTAKPTEVVGWHGWPADAPRPAIAPFDAAQAKKHQEEWAAYLKIPVEYTNSIGMKFVLIPPGEFMMGSTPEEYASAMHLILKTNQTHYTAQGFKASVPQHRVVLTQPYYLGVHEVTQKQFATILNENPSTFSPVGASKEVVREFDTSDFPVETVSWNKAIEFCEGLSDRESLSKSLFSQTDRYHLPTSAEWEFACRAGTTSKYWSGDSEDDLRRVDWCLPTRGNGRPHVVGELPSNPFGLHDLQGNVAEHVRDLWSEEYYQQFATDAAIDPRGPQEGKKPHVVRGGAAYKRPLFACGPAVSSWQWQADGESWCGIRVSISVPAVREAINRTPTSDWNGWPADAPQPAIAPFDAVQAKKHQEEWAAYLKLPVEHTNSIGMKFVLIPPGEFTMGSTAEEIAAALKYAGEDKHWQECIQSEAPQHKVILTQPIYLGVNEVTQAEYEKVMGTNPSHFAPMGMGKEAVAGLETAEHPVETVSWNDAAEFCAKLSNQEKLKPFYFRAGETITPLDGTGYRLPSEAEWEFACRAGTTTKYWCGDKDEDLVRAGWFGGNPGGRTHAAGELKANPFGLSDIHGNVWEWVQDGWDSSSYGQFSEKPAINPNSPFPASSQRLLRGGSWVGSASRCRSSHRDANVPTSRLLLIGFRVSLSVNAVREALNVTGPADQNAAKGGVKTTNTTGWHGWPADAPKPAIAPFDAPQARKHQDEWAAYLKVPVEYTNAINMKFRLIPPGEFMMGSTPDEIAEALEFTGNDMHWKRCIGSEHPRHKVVLTQPIYLGVHEVTQDAYAQVMAVNPSYFTPTGEGKVAVQGTNTGQHPVERVSWYDAIEFCTRLSKQEKRGPFYNRTGDAVTPLNGTGYRLLTEAEWEYACRAGTTTRYWNGDKYEDVAKVGWHGGNSGKRIHAVGELPANPFGLYDMHGNAWEWVQDGWDSTFYAAFTDKPAINPTSPFFPGSLRVLRGGEWLGGESLCRSSDRNARAPQDAFHVAGFRVALSLDAVNQALKVTRAASPR